jgi:ribosomal protein S15P/S13E
MKLTPVGRMYKRVFMLTARINQLSFHQTNKKKDHALPTRVTQNDWSTQALIELYSQTKNFPLPSINSTLRIRG